jgi:hypothetical protein
MKNVFKFKYLPVFALVLAGGMAVAGQAWMPAVAPTFYKDPADSQWKALAGRQQGSASGQYQCLSSSAQCTAETLVGGVPSGVTSGTFIINP